MSILNYSFWEFVCDLGLEDLCELYKEEFRRCRVCTYKVAWLS